MDELAQALKIVLANHYAYSLKAQNFHWNVEGRDFKQYHSFFEEIYSEVYSAIDTIAERIRTIGAYAPGSFSRYAELSQIEDQVEIPNAQDMLQKLLGDIEVIQTSIKVCYDIAEQSGNHGLSNLMAERQDAFAKHAWMLSATLKNR
jgi:starvation-inducible DNA-binding protein